MCSPYTYCRVKHKNITNAFKNRPQSKQVDDLYTVLLALAHQEYIQIRAVELTSNEHVKEVTAIKKLTSLQILKQ